MAKRALIVWGGWNGHQPEQVAGVFDRILREAGFETTVSDTLDAFKHEQKIRQLDLIVPVWTMGKITNEQISPVLAAVQAGVGIAGCHGGMCDSFRDNTDWQFMTGGQWVAHPGNDGVKHRIKMGPVKSPITDGIADFDVATEQYYMHVDPAVKVLATTEFPTAAGPHTGNGKVDMPVIWTKLFGEGRVFYSSLGHQVDIVEMEPHLTLLRRGLLWAARG